jgi:hypothetical protein
VPFSRQNFADFYRPDDAKPVQLGIPWSVGGQFPVSQVIDLSLPIRGLRIVFRGRLVVGTAGFSSVTPEGFLNGISNIVFQGTNSRQQGNVTLWNCDLATMWMLENLFGYRGAAYYSINSGSGETIVPSPSTPLSTAYNPVGSTGTYDWRIVLDIPVHPHGSNVLGREPLLIPQYLVRNEEWKDSLQLLFTFGTQAGASGVGFLGAAASGTTVTFSAYGSGSGSPTIDVYSLPVRSGLALKDGVLPGVLSRVTQPVTSSFMTTAGTNVVLFNMQKQPTPRVFIKQGVQNTAAAAVPAFSALSDTNITTLGVLLGANRNVRNKVDIWPNNKLRFQDDYMRDPIQGYMVFDFMNNGNPDSAFPAQNVGDGATYQLVGDVTGVSNGAALVVQEQILQQPTGQLVEF